VAADALGKNQQEEEMVRVEEGLKKEESSSKRMVR
jgi:hypothetical protein